MAEATYAVLSKVVGPEDLRIPASRTQLRDALERLGRVIDALDRSRAALDEAAGEEDLRGETARALQRVVRFSRFTARRDKQMLEQLGDALQHLIETVQDVKGGRVEELRQEWHAARQEFVGAGPKGEGRRALARQIDSKQVNERAGMVKNVLGIVPAPHEGKSFLMDADLEQEVQQYRRTVRSVLDEWEGSVRRVRQAQRAVREHMVWEKREKSPDNGGGQGSKHDSDVEGISAHRDVRRLIDALQDGAEVLAAVQGQIEPIGKAIENAMLPHHSDDGDPQSKTFGQSWERHLERRIKRMRFVSRTSRQLVKELRRLDEDTAQQIFADKDDD